MQAIYTQSKMKLAKCRSTMVFQWSLLAAEGKATPAKNTMAGTSLLEVWTEWSIVP